MRLEQEQFSACICLFQWDEAWYRLKDNLGFPFRRNFWDFAFLRKDSFKYLTSVNRGRMPSKTERNVP